MSKYEIQAMLSDDKSQTTVQIVVGGEPQGWVSLSAAELDIMISNLCVLRGEMTDEVPRELSADTVMVTVPDPAWVLGGHPDGTRELALRHPGIGWLSFQFPPQEAEAVSAALGSDLPAGWRRDLN